MYECIKLSCTIPYNIICQSYLIKLGENKKLVHILWSSGTYNARPLAACFQSVMRWKSCAGKCSVFLSTLFSWAVFFFIARLSRWRKQWDDLHSRLSSLSHYRLVVYSVWTSAGQSLDHTWSAELQGFFQSVDDCIAGLVVLTVFFCPLLLWLAS